MTAARGDTPFSLEHEIARVTADYLEANGIKPGECWQCGSRVNVTGKGRMARCGGCHAAEIQEARREAAEERREERYDERSDD